MSISKDTRWYTTIQGDTWDMIAKKMYGDEFMMDLLMDYNPDYLDIVVFDSDYILEIPPIEIYEEEDDRGALWE